MYFGTKNYLKSNHNHTIKQARYIKGLFYAFFFVVFVGRLGSIDCFLKYFFILKDIKIIFFIFKKLFFTLIH
jgi:hypothetical protein